MFKEIGIITFSVILFSSCGTKTEAYKIAKNYLLNDSVVISKIGKKAEVANFIPKFIICNEDINDKYGGPFALFDIPIKDSDADKYTKSYVFLKKENEKWVGDTIMYDPDEKTIMEVFLKYGF